jgi:CheY-like chemotaxis protein
VHAAPVAAEFGAPLLQHDREHTLAAGYQAHLAKPVDASELFRVLWELTSRRRRD